MSRFKFRAWDELSKTFMMPPENGCFYFQEDGSLACAYLERTPAPSLPLKQRFGELIYCPITQWTGLRDKNLVGIFEGDFLSREGEMHAITVESLHGHRFMFGKDQLCRADAIYGEVIGNIYENPELLDENQ